MANDRTIRRLSALQESASTARVLNLVRVHKMFPDDAAIKTAPFFRNKVLDRSLIVKHRLRPNDRAMLTGIVQRERPSFQIMGSNETIPRHRLQPQPQPHQYKG